jgi:hypothetical protein
MKAHLGWCSSSAASIHSSDTDSPCSALITTTLLASGLSESSASSSGVAAFILRVSASILENVPLLKATTLSPRKTSHQVHSSQCQPLRTYVCLWYPKVPEACAYIQSILVTHHSAYDRQHRLSRRPVAPFHPCGLAPDLPPTFAESPTLDIYQSPCAVPLPYIIFMPFSTPCLPIEINARQVPTIRSAHVTGDQRVFPQIRVAN